ncbi:uncharacterized protein LOC135143456 [Zophobas morio]|uniref:uncharacterized protein LOC135143456 n=1 Tax=Zophobas morio TaxID=2755281 RepID=UPI003083877F
MVVATLQIPAAELFLHQRDSSMLVLENYYTMKPEGRMKVGISCHFNYSLLSLAGYAQVSGLGLEAPERKFILLSTTGSYMLAQLFDGHRQGEEALASKKTDTKKEKKLKKKEKHNKHKFAEHISLKFGHPHRLKKKYYQEDDKKNFLLNRIFVTDKNPPVVDRETQIVTIFSMHEDYKSYKKFELEFLLQEINVGKKWHDILVEMSISTNNHYWSKKSLEDLEKLLEKVRDEHEKSHLDKGLYSIIVGQLHKHIKERQASLSLSKFEKKKKSRHEKVNFSELIEDSLKHSPQKEEVENYYENMNALLFMLSKFFCSQACLHALLCFGELYGISLYYTLTIIIKKLKGKFSLAKNCKVSEDFLDWFALYQPSLELLCDMHRTTNQNASDFHNNYIKERSLWLATPEEQESCHAAVKEIFQQIENRISHYKNYFPYGRGGISEAISMYSLSHEFLVAAGIFTDELIEKLKEALFTSCQEKYVQLRGTIRADKSGRMEAVELLNLCNLIFLELRDDKQYFSEPFYSCIDLLLLNLKCFIQSYSLELLEYLSYSDKKDPCLIEVYLKLKEIENEFSYIGEVNFAPIFIEFEPVIKQWMLRSSNLAKEWIMRAVAINQSSTFEATDTLTIKHSSSVVDFFCFANETYKILRTLDWKETETRTKLDLEMMEFVCNSSQTYASEVVNNIRVYLNTQNNDLPKVLRFWTLEYFFALNNVYVMSSESEALIKALIDDLIYIETEMNKKVARRGAHVTLLPGMNSLAAPSKNKNDPLQGSDDYAALSESNRRALKTLLDQYYASIENSLKVLVINVIRTMDSTIEKNVSRLLKGALSIELGPDTPEESFRDVSQSFIGPLFDFLDDRLLLLSTNLYDAIFKKILLTLWKRIALIGCAFTCPDYSQRKERCIDSFIGNSCYSLVLDTLECIKNYFYAGGIGLSQEQLECEEYYNLLNILKFCATTTEDLISIYELKKSELALQVLKNRVKCEAAMKFLEKEDGVRYDYESHPRYEFFR